MNLYKLIWTINEFNLSKILVKNVCLYKLDYVELSPNQTSRWYYMSLKSIIEDWIIIKLHIKYNIKSVKISQIMKHINKRTEKFIIGTALDSLTFWKLFNMHCLHNIRSNVSSFIMEWI